MDPYYTISKEFHFSAAHRLEGHPKCGRLHGHNYKVTVFLESRSLEEGMVVDYGMVKSDVQPFIDQLDHRYLVSEHNITHDDPLSKRDDVIWLPIRYSTAECLARWLLDELRKISPRYSKVMVQETPSTTAEAVRYE